MKCKICDEELDIPKITCKCCHNEVIFIDNRIIDVLTHQYAHTQNRVNKYSENTHDNSSKIRIIKNAKLEVYKEMLNVLKFALEDYTDVDLSEIEIPNYIVEMPRMCDIDRNKVCNGCMDC